MYWTGTGLSSPFAWLNAMISGRLAFGPRIALATPPGSMRVRMKVRRVTPKTTTIDCPILRIRKPVTVSAPTLGSGGGAAPAAPRVFLLGEVPVLGVDRQQRVLGIDALQVRLDLRQLVVEDREPDNGQVLGQEVLVLVQRLDGVAGQRRL